MLHPRPGHRMLIVNRHTTRDDGPFLATLRIQPATRSQLTDVRGRLLEEFGDDFARFARSFYISDHTTAGYLDQRMAELLEHDRSGIDDYLELFRELFPPGADYVHDTMELRSELTEEQRASEPLNADSHLTFIGAGLRNSASYELKGGEPVWFVELDGVHLGGTRQRRNWPRPADPDGAPHPSSPSSEASAPPRRRQCPPRYPPDGQLDTLSRHTGGQRSRSSASSGPRLDGRCRRIPLRARRPAGCRLAVQDRTGSCRQEPSTGARIRTRNT